MRQADKAVKLGISALCVAMVVLCAMFMASPVYRGVAVGGFALLSVIYCVASGRVERTLLVTIVACAAIAACYMLYVNTGLSAKFSDFDALREYILASGVWGVLIFIALTVFQVVVLPIPEAVTILLGVAIYGPTSSFILSVIGTIIGSLISFMLGKVFGRRLCDYMFGEEATKKYAAILNERGRFLFILMLLFPAFPDDMLCMIAGITDMSYVYFTLICLATRPVMIGLTAYLGSGIIPFSGAGIPIWIALACLLFVLFMVISGIKKQIEKRPHAKR